MSTAECRNGHDLAVLGRYPSGWNAGRCVACYRAKRSRMETSPAGRARQNRKKRIRYQTNNAVRMKDNAKSLAYRQTVSGQLSIGRGQLRYHIRHTEARIAELERELQYAQA